MVRKQQPTWAPKLQLPLQAPAYTEWTVGPAGSNTATTAQDAVSQAGSVNQSKLSGRGTVELLACASTTTHNCVVRLHRKPSWKLTLKKSIYNQLNKLMQLTSDISYYWLALGKGTGSEDFLPWWQGSLRLVKAFQGTSLLVCKGLVSRWQCVEILSLHLPMSGNNLHCLEISSFTHGLKIRSDVLKM